MKYGLIVSKEGFDWRSHILFGDDLYDTLDAALNEAALCLRYGQQPLSLIQYDQETHAVVTILKGSDFYDRANEYLHENILLDAPEETGGSYVRQHTQTVRDVL